MRTKDEQPARSRGESELRLLGGCRAAARPQAARQFAARSLAARKFAAPRTSACAALLLLALPSGNAQAQPQDPPADAPEVAPEVDAEADTAAPEEPEAPAAPRVTPPRLVRATQVTRPLGSSLESVLVELVIDEAGAVTSAEVLSPGVSAQLQQRVERAARNFKFEPALQDDSPVAVKIRVRVQLLKPAEARKPKTTPSPALRRGQPPKSGDESAETAASAEEEELVYEATAEVEGPPAGVTRHRLGAAELRKMPGTRGDPIRAVEVLPGVARSGGDPILRGVSSNESQVLFDGAPVPLLYHFGGITSIVQGRLVSRIDYQPGNFSARYGRVSGGLIAVESRDPMSDRLHLMVDLSLLESAALVEGPLGERTAVALAARRSNIDFFFGQFVPEDAYSVVAAPVYWDYQAFASHRLDRRHKLRLTSYGSRDSISLLVSNPEETDPALRGEVSGALEFHRVQLALESELSDRVDTRVQATYGRQYLSQRTGPLESQFTADEVFARGDLKFRASDRVELRAGLDFAYFGLRGSYQGNRPPQWEGDPGGDAPLATGQLIEIVDEPYTASPGAYAEVALVPFEPLEVTLGLRGDYFEHLRAFSLDPRLSARYTLSPETTLKGGVGRYTQQPNYYDSIPGLGNPEIEPYYAIHTSAGVEQKLGRAVELGVEGFYKWLGHRVVSTADQQAPYFVNDGEGRVYGAELSTRLTLDETRGYLAYTLSRSERKDREDAYRLFDQDQTHVLALALSQGLGRGWEVGARFRLTSGNPTTPIQTAVFDSTTGQYAPVYGAVNSERLPYHHQLDLRVEKQWKFEAFSLAAYLDLINAYNAENREGTSYSYNYKRSEAVSGLPIFPSLGLRGEL